MKLNAYSVYDLKTKSWGAPHFLRSNGEAVRSFIMATQDPNTMFSKFPEDYMLMHVGEFDDETGGLKSESPISLGTARAFITEPETKKVEVI